MAEVDDIKTRKDQAFKMWEYAVQRIDLLIISICGAGIYVSLETLKYIMDKKLADSTDVKVAGGLFLLAIVINFVSQFFGKTANEKDIEWGDAKIEYLDKPSSDLESYIKNIDNSADCYSDWTNYLNIASLIVMFSGLGFLMYYFLITF